VQEFKKPQHAGALWIMKPIARSQGKGIFLFNKLAQITQWKSEYRWKPENAAVSTAHRPGRNFIAPCPGKAATKHILV